MGDDSSAMVVNDQWKHAGSAEHIIKRKALEAEVEFLRGMFTTVLPVSGPKEVEAINDYFNKLKEVISTIDDVDTIPREEFPDTDGSTPGRISDYKYFSATEAKERSSRYALFPDPQDVADSYHHGESRGPVQIYDSELQDFQCVPQLPEGEAPCHQD